MASTTFTLSRDPFGKLVMTAEDGQVFEGVAPVRAFPIQSPDEGISLVLGNGKEVAWIERLDALPEPARSLLQEELEGREFMPEIARVKSVSKLRHAMHLACGHGPGRDAIRAERRGRHPPHRRHIAADRRQPRHPLLIRDMFNIDKTTRKILDRFL